MFVSAILAAGGRGRRLGSTIPKQLFAIGDRSILQRSFETIVNHDLINEVVVALPSELVASPPPFLRHAHKRVHVAAGGTRRQDSVAMAFEQISDRSELIVIHDAARPFATGPLFTSVIEAADAAGAAIAALQASDTVKEADEHDGFMHIVRTLPRARIYLAQTPQAFQRQVLSEAIERGRQAAEATDEAALAEEAGHRVQLVEGERWNLKITTEDDLKAARSLVGAGQMRIGVGYDLHRLESGRRLRLGGVEIPHDRGLAGHSDADVLCHAVTDAILGAAAQGDIGRHFPDTADQWKDADSIQLLKQSVQIVRSAGYAIANVDAVVIAEQPKLLPYIERIRSNLAGALAVDVSAVSVKGKTNERVGELGRAEAIAVHAVAMVTRV